MSSEYLLLEYCIRSVHLPTKHDGNSCSSILTSICWCLKCRLHFFPYINKNRNRCPYKPHQWHCQEAPQLLQQTQRKENYFMLLGKCLVSPGLLLFSIKCFWSSPPKAHLWEVAFECRNLGLIRSLFLPSVQVKCRIRKIRTRSEPSFFCFNPQYVVLC